MLKRIFKKSKGITLVEILLATVLVTVLITGIAGAMSYSINSSSKSNQASYATYLAQEAIDALRNIRDQNFANLVDGTYGLVLVGTQWTLSVSADTTSIYTRQVTITSQNADTKRAVVTITWAGQTYTQIIELTQWAAAPVTGIGSTVGMLVYGDGGTTTDTIKYKLLKTDGTWTAAANTADIDASTNRALVSAKLFSSKTRNEKILVSKHCNGSTVYFYAQVWNGITQTWGNVNAVGSYANASCVNVAQEDYSATYLDLSGDFVVSYNDKTVITKYKVWNGGYWTAALNIPAFANYAYWIELTNRPNTNEMYLVHYSTAASTRTVYFNGGAYVLANWSAITTVQNSGNTDLARTIDAKFSPTSTTKVNLTYPKTNTDLTATARICTSTTSNCTLGTAVNAATYSTKIRSAIISARPVAAANEFMQCNKYGTAAPYSIACRRSNVTPTFTTPTNPIISTISDPTGIELNYDFQYGLSTGNNGIIVYGDETNLPKLKKYNPTTNTFDAGATSLGSLASVAKSVKIVPMPGSDDQMILIGNVNAGFSTQVWNATTNTIYTTPVGKALTLHGSNGYNYQDFYFDFSWDYTIPALAKIQDFYTIGTTTTPAPQVVSFQQPVTAGNTVIVTTATFSNGFGCTMVGSTVVDNISTSNVYNYITESVGGSSCITMWYSNIVTGGSNFTITITPPDPRVITGSIVEYKGIISASPIDKTTTASGTDTTGSCGSITTTNPRDLIICGIVHDSGVYIEATVAPSYSYRTYYPDGKDEPIYVFDRFSTTTGVSNPSIILGVYTVYASVMVAFKGV